MLDIVCPDCDERSDLRGTRRGDQIMLRCGACGATWERDPTRRCRLCGATDLRYTPKPLWEKGRGDQRTPAGRIDAYACNQCGGRGVTSTSPMSAPDR